MSSIYSADFQQLLALLIAARKDAKLTQVELADRLNKPQSFVSKYERGERRLDVLEFLKVCKALRTNHCEMLQQITLTE